MTWLRPGGRGGDGDKESGSEFIFKTKPARFAGRLDVGFGRKRSQRCLNVCGHLLNEGRLGHGRA